MQVTPSEFAHALDLTVINSVPSEQTRPIEVPDICRPGLQFAGYFDVFSDELPQLIGKTDASEFDGVAGATMSSDLMRKTIQMAVDAFQLVKEA